MATRSKLVGGIFHLGSFKEIARHSLSDVKHEQQKTLYRHGAGEARGAHNSEDIGSKPIAGINHQLASVHQGTRANTKHQSSNNPASKVGLSDYKQSGYGLIGSIQIILSK